MSKRIKNLNRALITEAIVDFAHGLPEETSVLDVGAGSGHYRSVFGAQNYFAIDRGYEQADISGLSAVADIAAIPFADGVMDAAVCMEVLEHVRDPIRVLREIRRVVRPGGRVMVSTPFCLGEHMQPYDFFRYTRFELKEMFERSGFKVVAIEPRGGYFTLLAYMLARVPDEMFRNTRGWGKYLKPVVRLLTTYSLAKIVLAMDGFDKRRDFTLGFISIVERN